MDNEKYGIELELLTSKFNSKINETKQKVKELSVFSKAGAFQYDSAGIENYINGINRAKNSMNNLNTSAEQLKAKTEAIRKKDAKLNVELDKTKSKFKGINATATTNAIQKGFDKATSKIKKFGFALFSIRSTWSLIGRASSAYLSADTDLANRLQSVWTGLGAMLAPVIEAIVNTLAKGVKYINIFIKALTGVDLLAKATSKSMKNTAKSAKALNKSLAGFDDLTNLDTDAGGGDVGIEPGAFAGLDDVDINMEWAEKIKKFAEWIKENKDEIIIGVSGIVGAFLTFKVLNSLAGIGAIDLGFGSIIRIAAGVGLAIASVVYAVQALIDYLKDPSFFNFGKIIQGIGGAIAGIGIAFASLPAIITGVVVIIVGTILKYWEQIKAFLQSGIDWLVSKTDWVKENFGVIGEFIYGIFTGALQAVLNIFDSLFTGIKGVFDGIINFFKAVFTGQWGDAWEAIKQIVMSVVNAIWGIIKAVFVDFLYNSIILPIWEMFKWVWNGIKDLAVKAWEGIKSVWNAVTGWFKDKIITPIGNFFKGMWDGLKNGAKNAWEGIKSIFSKVTDFFKNIFGNAWNAVKNVFSVGGKIFSGIKDGIVNAFKSVVNAIINGINKVVSIPFNAINAVLNGLRNINILGVEPFKWIGTIGVPQIPLLNVGTNYVPEDQLAMIHKGEAVVPKKFNSKEYFGNGNEETNMLLNRVIEAINNIEINPYTTVKDVGSASLAYINKKSRQLGESVVV